jgi:hypothetical protein
MDATEYLLNFIERLEEGLGEKPQELAISMNVNPAGESNLVEPKLSHVFESYCVNTKVVYD